MNSHATDVFPTRETGPAPASRALARSVASATPGSEKAALHLGRLGRAAAALGIVSASLCPALSQAQEPGSLSNTGSQNSAQASMAKSINTVCPNLDARANSPDRTVAESQLNGVCANMVFNGGGTYLEIWYALPASARPRLICLADPQGARRDTGFDTVELGYLALALDRTARRSAR